jgi:hypothetical protein
MRKHLGKARYGAIAVLVAAAVFLFLQMKTINDNRARANMMLLLPTPQELAVALHRAGLGPEVLAAAGLGPGNIESVVGEAFQDIAEQPGALDLGDAALGDARRQCSELERIIQSGQATDEQIAAHPAAAAELAQAEAQCEGVLAGLFDAGTAGLSNAQRQKLSAIRANRRWDLPTEFLVVDRSEAQWVLLRDCLANERIAVQLGEDPDPQAQQILAEGRSHPLVAAAKANLDANLDVVTSVWEQAIGQDDAPPE